LAPTALFLILGAMVAARAGDPPSVGPVVQMEPFFVPGNGVPWRYVQVPGYEILSHYPDFTTGEFLRGLERAMQLLDFVVPEEFQAKFDVPHVIILCDQDMMSSMSKDIMDSAASRSVWSTNGFNGQSSVRAFPNVEAVDKDRIASLVTNQEESMDGRIVLVDPGHVRYLLETRTPPLPPWLLTGLTDLYGELYGANKTTSVTNADAVDQRRRRDEGDRKIALTESDLVSTDKYSGSDTHQRNTEMVYRIPPFTWISPGDTMGIKNGKEFFRGRETDGASLMGDLLEKEPPLDRAEWEAWKARASLFVRWAIDREYQPYSNPVTKFLDLATAGPVNERYVVDGANSPHRAAFWKFTTRACAEPATEAMFRDCFGMSYSEAASRLADYLPVAVKNPIDIRIKSPSAGATQALRDATGPEIVRIKGDWERLAIASVKAEFHDYTSNYIHKALTQAYDRGARDPRLLAAMGLFDCDLGDDVGAKPYLEAAAAAKVVGPRVYFELARIRFAEMRPGDDSRLGAADVDQVIAPLVAGLQQSPPLRETFDLALRALAISDGALTAGQMELLAAGLRFFPRDMDLLFKVASLDAEHGHPAEAEALAEAGIRLSPFAENRIRFSTLRAQAAKSIPTP
jgi:hypothetical protein